MHLIILIADNSKRFASARYNALLENLTEEMRNYASRFHFWKDAQAFVLGKCLTMKALQQMGCEFNVLKSIVKNPFGKPYLPDSDVTFSVSHSGDFVLCAAGKNIAVGIDIERIDYIDVDGFAIAFSPAEFQSLKSASNFSVALLRSWTIKEAVAKADGRGLSIPLPQIKIEDDGIVNVCKSIWYFTDILSLPGYIAHLATNRMVNRNDVHIAYPVL